MRPTRLGAGAAAMLVLTLLVAAATGNNLLYLLYGALAAAFALSVLLGRWNLRAVAASVEPGTQAFRGRDFPLVLRVENRGHSTAYGLRLRWGARSRGLDSLLSGARSLARLSCQAPHRGRNALEELYLESRFPFGLISHRKRVAASVVALPQTAPARSPAELTADAESSGRPELKRGRGEELFGVRAYDPADEARMINWKLSARAGKLLVNEYCESVPTHVTIRVPGGSGPKAERAIEAAATACRYYSDVGASVELVTPTERVGPARGLRHLDRMLESLALIGEGASPRPAPPPREPAAPEPEDARWHASTFVMLAFVFASMFLIDELDPRMLWALSLFLPLGWWVQKRGRSPLPEWLWSALSLAALGYGVLIDWRVTGLTVANAHLLLYMLANRALHPLSRKDLPQVFLIEFLGFFLASGLTISLWYFAFFVVYLVVAAAWLLSAAEVRRGGARLISGLTAGALALSVLTFMATPRVEGLRKINPFLALGIDKLAVNRAAVTGFTENVRLGYFGLLRKSSARVMQIRTGAPPAGARPEPVYIRGAAYDVFDGALWRKTQGDFAFRLDGRRYPSRGGRAWAPREAGALTLPARLSPSGKTEDYDFTIYPMSVTVVFTVGTPWRIESDQAVSFDETGNLSFASPYSRGARYVEDAAEGGGLALELSPAERRAALAPLSKDPRVRALALAATRGARDPLEKTQAVESFLRRRYAYSLFGEGPGHTLEDFLFHSKRGDCEYFATAGVALLREAGVPARLASGFLASEWNEYGRFYDVRQSEAHAWVEAFVPARGWVTVDPTPGEGGFSAAFGDLGQRLSRWFDSVQLQWYQHVIGYDHYVQGNTFRRLSVAFSPKAMAKAGAAAGRAAAALAVLAGLFALLRARLRRIKRRAPGLWERAESLLAKAGEERPAWMTPREFARALAARSPAFSELPSLAELHYALAYGGRALSAREASAVARVLRALKESR